MKNVLPWLKSWGFHLQLPSVTTFVFRRETSAVLVCGIRTESWGRRKPVLTRALTSFPLGAPFDDASVPQSCACVKGSFRFGAAFWGTASPGGPGLRRVLCRLLKVFLLMSSGSEVLPTPASAVGQLVLREWWGRAGAGG